jgi:hypothetical protein
MVVTLTPVTIEYLDGDWSPSAGSAPAALAVAFDEEFVEAPLYAETPVGMLIRLSSATFANVVAASVTMFQDNSEDTVYAGQQVTVALGEYTEGGIGPNLFRTVFSSNSDGELAPQVTTPVTIAQPTLAIAVVLPGESDGLFGLDFLSVTLTLDDGMSAAFFALLCDQ